MLRTRENSDVFNSLDEIYLVFTSKKQISSIYIPAKVNHGQLQILLFRCYLLSVEVPVDSLEAYPLISATESFQSDRPCNKPWIQIDLEEFIEVHAVLVFRKRRKCNSHGI